MSHFEDCLDYKVCIGFFFQKVQPLGEVIVNRTGCGPLTEMDVSLFLDTNIDFETIEFYGAFLNFNNRNRHLPVSFVKTIIFSKCIFDTIPGGAFEGLDKLEHIVFVNNYIRVLDSYSISNLNQLFFLEIDNSNISSIESNAMSGIPNLEEISILRSTIGSMKHNSIHIMRTPDSTAVKACELKIDLRTGEGRDARVMEDVMARNFEITNNLPIPEFGARLLIYGTNISVIEKSAVESDIFSFVIVTGSNFETIAQNAFNIELSNQCEISAFMVVQNDIQKIEPKVFAQIKSKLENEHKTYMVMINNTFRSVEVGGFKFDPSMEIFNLEENKFVCECLYFLWNYVSKNLTRTSDAKIYDQNITNTATCIKDGIEVNKFLSTCSEQEFLKTTTEIPSKSGSCDLSCSNLYLFCMIFCCTFYINYLNR